ncbi:MAG: serine/threonine protein kinase [Deltaproteobacteria bacterium]|nr:serine/threonine protein kinase [Deltaproteobacteria bacterium]
MVLAAGDLIDQRYRVTELLGRGGMGEVWAAVCLADRRQVAIKVLLERASRKTDIVARFKREAKVAARIRSPFVCALLDTARTPAGGLALVFEYLRGESLADRLKKENDLPFGEVDRIMNDVWQGIVDAHAAGVLHRDLKPGNIHLARREGERERAVILDFGVSKIKKAARLVDEPSLTMFDGTVGSFAYMAPEQVRGAARVDERADVYGAGAVAFRALTGHLPFEGVTAKMVVSLKMGRPPPSLEEVTGVRWPKVIEQFFARTLARGASQRFATAQEAQTSWQEVGAEMRRARTAAAMRARMGWPSG